MPDDDFSTVSGSGGGLTSDRASRLLETALTTKDESPGGWRELVWRAPSVKELLEWVPEYEVEQRVARGSSGWVYVARHRLLDRQVALKVLLPAEAPYVSETAAVRSMEGRMIARLSHPNVLRVYDSRPLPDGFHLLVFEYAEGGSLRQRLGVKGLRRTEVLPMAEGIARGLAEAHAAGIIHRDLKPENILFQKEGIPLIGDFGSAVNPAGGDAGEGDGTTGTLNYRAPEQVAGGALTVAADLYAFGVVLHEMLTGKVPEGTGLAKPVVLDAEVPAEWRALLTQLLLPEPKRRGPAAAELVERLRRMGRPLVSRRVWAAGVAGGLMVAGSWLFVRGSSGGFQDREGGMQVPVVRQLTRAEAQAEVEEVLEDYRAAEARGDWEAGNQFYAGEVDYFGEGVLSHAEVVGRRMAHVGSRVYHRMLLLEPPSRDPAWPEVSHRGFYWMAARRVGGGFDLGFVKDDLVMAQAPAGSAAGGAPGWLITTHRQGGPTVVWSCEEGLTLSDAQAVAWVERFLKDEASGGVEAQLTHYAPVTRYYQEGWIATRFVRASLQKRAVDRPGFRCEQKGPVTVVAGSCLRWRVSFPCLSYPILTTLAGGDHVRMRTFLLAPKPGGQWQVIAEASTISGQEELDAFWNAGAGWKD